MISSGDIERSMARRGMQLPRDRAHALIKHCEEFGLDPARCGVWPPRDTVLRSRALAMARQATKPANNTPSDLLWLMNVGDPSSRVIVNASHQTGGTITDSGTNGIYTVASGAPYTAALHDEQQIHIVGAPTPANNGTFLITAATTTTLTYGNPAAVTEAVPAADVYTFGIFDSAADLSGNPSGLLGSVGGSFSDALAGAGAATLRVDAQSFWLSGGNYIGYRAVAGVSALVSEPDFSGVQAMDGNVVSTIGAYAKIDNNAAGDLIAISANSGAVVNEAVRLRPNGASGMRLVKRANANGNVTVNYDVAHTIDTAGFHLYVFVYVGTTAELWVDGVLIGSTDPGLSAFPSVMDRIIFGSVTTGQGTGLTRLVGSFGVARRLSGAEQIALKNYFAASVLTPGEALPP